MKKIKTFAVLYGMEGMKSGFRKLKTARKFAKEKAQKSKKPVEIDIVTSYYPHLRYALKGEPRVVDWSQGFYETVLPSGKITKRVLTPAELSKKMGKVI